VTASSISLPEKNGYQDKETVQQKVLIEEQSPPVPFLPNKIRKEPLEQPLERQIISHQSDKAVNQVPIVTSAAVAVNHLQNNYQSQTSTKANDDTTSVIALGERNLAALVASASATDKSSTSLHLPLAPPPSTGLRRKHSTAVTASARKCLTVNNVAGSAASNSVTIASVSGAVPEQTLLDSHG
jgi:hypothetical protein